MLVDDSDSILSIVQTLHACLEFSLTRGVYIPRSFSGQSRMGPLIIVAFSPFVHLCLRVGMLCLKLRTHVLVHTLVRPIVLWASDSASFEFYPEPDPPYGELAEPQ